MINLRLGEVGLFDFHRADELIARGEAAAKRHLHDMHREIDARKHAPGAHVGVVEVA
jgi:NTE family protein